MKQNFRIVIMLLVILISGWGCVASFKPAEIDKATGQFPASTDVDKKHVKIFQPLAGIKEAKYIYLRTHSQFQNDKFYDFMKDALIKIGFENVYSERELSRMIVRSGLSSFVTSISDMVSLNNLAKVTGPFLVLQSNVFLVGDCVYEFDLEMIEPLSGNTYLEISRVRTAWLDIDKEVNYPILNVIKQWHDESAALPFSKPEKKKAPEGTI